MSEFIATFNTHLAAIMADRQLKALGLRSTMLPVPRALSSSCGTAVRYAADSAHIDALGAPDHGQLDEVSCGALDGGIQNNSLRALADIEIAALQLRHIAPAAEDGFRMEIQTQ